MTAVGDLAWLHPAWAALVSLLLWLRARGRLPLPAAIPRLLLGGLALRLLWHAFGGSEGVETLAAVPATYLLPAVLLELARRFPAPADDPLRVALARTRDLALVLGLAAAIVVTNGIALRIDQHELVRAGTACAVWLLFLRTLLELRPQMPPARALDPAPLLPAVFAAIEAVRLFSGAAEPVRSGLDVGMFPLWNALLAGYAVPAGLLFLTARTSTDHRVRAVAGAVSLAFLLAWLHYATRQIFHGPILSGPMAEAERLAVLAVWLGFALLCLAISLRRGSPAAAAAAAVTAVVAAIRALVFDTAALSGRWLGAELAAVGLVAVCVFATWRRLRAEPAQRPFAGRRGMPMSGVDAGGSGER